MSPGVQILLSGALSFGVPLAIAARELIVLRRRGRGSWRPGDPPVEPPPSPLSWTPSLPPLRPQFDPVEGLEPSPRPVRTPELV